MITLDEATVGPGSTGNDAPAASGSGGGGGGGGGMVIGIVVGAVGLCLAIVFGVALVRTTRRVARLKQSPVYMNVNSGVFTTYPSFGPVPATHGNEDLATYGSPGAAVITEVATDGPYYSSIAADDDGNADAFYEPVDKTGSAGPTSSAAGPRHRGSGGVVAESRPEYVNGARALVILAGKSPSVEADPGNYAAAVARNPNYTWSKRWGHQTAKASRPAGTRGGRTRTRTIRQPGCPTATRPRSTRQPSVPSNRTTLQS